MDFKLKFSTYYHTGFIRSVIYLGHWVPMCAFVALGFISSADENLAIALLVIAVGINSSTYLGFQVCNLNFKEIIFIYCCIFYVCVSLFFRLIILISLQILLAS